MKRKYKKKFVKLFVALIIAAGGYVGVEYHQSTVSYASDLEDIPEYDGKPYVIINDNEPYFDQGDFTTKSFEEYSPLDDLGRCGVAT